MVLTIITVSWTNVVVVATVFIVYWTTGYSHALTQQQQQSSLTTRGNNNNNNNNVGEDKIMISPFIDSRWIIRLDFGLEPGSFMPQRFPDWAVSGARLGVPVELLFTNNIVAEVPDNVTALFGVGNDKVKVKVNNIIPMFRRVEVSPMTVNSTFVSERGQECVSFAGGGYSMERSSLYNKNDDLLGIVEGIPKPRFLLRFWIDCTSGAKRNDVELKPFSRIIGTIPIWDDPGQIQLLEQELVTTKTLILQEKQQKQKKNSKNHQDEYDPMNPNASCNDNDNDDGIKSKSKSKSLLRKWLFFGGEKNTDNNNNDDDDDESSLEYRQEQLERLLPLKGSLTFDNGVTTAPKGSLVIPYYQDEKEEDESLSSGNGVRKQHKYLIVGSFSMKHSKG
jgi:hypothetical protein